ncbi:MAG: DcrB-related protein [Myxococcales bacterium]|nr:DcrB-related protein [Myxococcales bacterium]
MTSYVYHLDEGIVTLPPGFKDATINVFEWQDAKGRHTLTVQRERRLPNLTFDDMVARIVAIYPQKFTAFAEEPPMEIALELPAVSKRFRWRNQDGVVYNHQIFVDLEDTFMIFTASAKANIRERADDALHDALSGLRLRERA